MQTMTTVYDFADLAKPHNSVVKSAKKNSFLKNHVKAR